LAIHNDEQRKKVSSKSSSAREAAERRRRSFLHFFHSVHFWYFVIPSVILSIVTIFSATSPNSWVVSDADHFYFEIFAVILSTIVAFYCITRAYTLNERFSLYIGIGFSTIAVIDLLHAIFSFIAVGNNQFLSYFIPQTWFAGRTFLGAMLVIAVAKYAPKVETQDEIQREKKVQGKPQRNDILSDKVDARKYDFSYEVRSNSSANGEEKDNFDSTNNQHVGQEGEKLHVSLLLPLFVLAFLAVSVVVISFFTIFPGIVLPYSLARPYENPSLILFAIALFLFYKKKLYKSNDAFYKGILGALIIDVFGQIIMSYSSTNFHTAHNVAHMLKNTGYFIIILSLAVSSIQYNKIAKQRESTIRLQYNKLKEMDKMKDEFINVAAHELRTPIQPIIGLSEILRSRIRNNNHGDSHSNINAENQEFVDVILRNGQRLGKLVEDVLDVTKIESQSLELRREHFDLNELIISIIDDIMAAEAESMVYGLPARRKGKNNVKITYQPRPLQVHADKNRIAQVISNLLNNAIKFTSEGYVTITAEKREKNSNSHDVVIISVCDSGSGVDPEMMPRLFTKFSSKSFSGTGLGLYICKNIIEAHGGSIWAENNNKAKGATFSFTLPLVN
jgi:signal transduction histidine kinase